MVSKRPVLDDTLHTLSFR